ncbi:MAG: hypothetical protein Q8Q02_11370 [Nocardioides sp.]|nr:hypothetical protein [Nocardioides sp.]
MMRVLAAWPARRWLAAAGATVAFVALVGVPTALIETPFFGREIPPTWWSWPSLLVTSVLAGLLVATYVAAPVPPESDRPGRGGVLASVLTFFAVGCPVCNKLVLVALGSAGALTWFEPVQPLLQLAAVALLVWALRQRLRGELACTVPDTAQLRPAHLAPRSEDPHA